MHLDMLIPDVPKIYGPVPGPRDEYMGPRKVHLEIERPIMR